jgi:hypothetical protein
VEDLCSATNSSAKCGFRGLQVSAICGQISPSVPVPRPVARECGALSSTLPQQECGASACRRAARLRRRGDPIRPQLYGRAPRGARRRRRCASHARRRRRERRPGTRGGTRRPGRRPVAAPSAPLRRAANSATRSSPSGLGRRAHPRQRASHAGKASASGTRRVPSAPFGQGRTRTPNDEERSRALLAGRTTGEP